VLVVVTLAEEAAASAAVVTVAVRVASVQEKQFTDRVRTAKI